MVHFHIKMKNLVSVYLICVTSCLWMSVAWYKKMVLLVLVSSRTKLFIHLLLCPWHGSDELCITKYSEQIRSNALATIFLFSHFIKNYKLRILHSGYQKGIICLFLNVITFCEVNQALLYKTIKINQSNKHIIIFYITAK